MNRSPEKLFWPGTDELKPVRPHGAGIYRSGFPNKKSFPFIERLGLKSVLYLCEESYPEQNTIFLEQHGISLYHCGTGGNREPFQQIPAELMRAALQIILDPRNRPILIHCNKGTHRTGCVVGCLRKIQDSWSLNAIFAEYRRFAGPKIRIIDLQYIDLFDGLVFQTLENRDERKEGEII